MATTVTEGRDVRSGSTRYVALDLCRGIACLMVVVMHSTHYLTPVSAATWAEAGGFGAVVREVCHRGWLGVPIFFVISGYCIAASAESTRRGADPSVIFFADGFDEFFPRIGSRSRRRSS
ncbi:MAG: acyltransferase family protein [Pirellulales bacterium]